MIDLSAKVFFGLQKDFLNAGQEHCRISTCIKLPHGLKIIVLSVIEWALKVLRWQRSGIDKIKYDTIIKMGK